MDIQIMFAYVALLIVAATVAMILRAEDVPKTPWTRAFLGTHSQVLIYGFMAAGVLSFVLGYDPTSPKDFVSVLTIAYTGIAGLKALISKDAEGATTSGEIKS